MKDWTIIPMQLTQSGKLMTYLPTKHDALVKALAKAFYWQKLLDQQLVVSGSDIARLEGVHHSVVNELLRLTLLAPDVIESVLAGHHPTMLPLMWFQRNSLPVNWEEQRSLIECL